MAVVRSEDRLPAGCKGKSNLDVVVVPEGHLAMDDGAFSALVDGADAVVSVLGHNLTFKGMYGQPPVDCAPTQCIESWPSRPAGRRPSSLL